MYLSCRTHSSHGSKTSLWSRGPQLGWLSLRGALFGWQSSPLPPLMSSTIHVENVLRRQPDKRCNCSVVNGDSISLLLPTSSATSALMRARLGKKLSPDDIATCTRNNCGIADKSSPPQYTRTQMHVTHPNNSKTLWNWVTKLIFFCTFVVVHLQPPVKHEECQLFLLVQAHLVKRISQLVKGLLHFCRSPLHLPIPLCIFSSSCFCTSFLGRAANGWLPLLPSYLGLALR